MIAMTVSGLWRPWILLALLSLVDHDHGGGRSGSLPGVKQELADLLTLVSKGKVQRVVHQTLALKDAPIAHEQMTQSEHLGKIILIP